MNGRLYLVCDRRERDFLRAACAGGVDVLQLRDKSLDDDGLRRAASVFRDVCDEFGVPFVLNDRPELAAEVGADGVHVGQDDASPAAASSNGIDVSSLIDTPAPYAGASRIRFNGFAGEPHGGRHLRSSQTTPRPSKC